MHLSYFEKRVALEFLESDILLVNQGIISLTSHRIIFGLISTKLTCSCNSCLAKFIQAKKYCDGLFDLLTLSVSKSNNLRGDTEALVYEIYAVVQSAHGCSEASNTVANKETQTLSQAEIQNFSPVSPADTYIVQEMHLSNINDPFQIPDL